MNKKMSTSRCSSSRSGRLSTASMYIDKLPVAVNVYDMFWTNEYTTNIGIGVYHTGVEVNEKEYAYGGHPFSFTGIYDITPKTAEELGEGYKFKQSIVVGITELDPDAIENLVEQMGNDFPGDQYHLLRKNCNHFAKEFVRILTGVNAFPKWLNRLAFFSSHIPFIEKAIPRDWLTPNALELAVKSHEDVEPPKKSKKASKSKASKHKSKSSKSKKSRHSSKELSSTHVSRPSSRASNSYSPSPSNSKILDLMTSDSDVETSRESPAPGSSSVNPVAGTSSIYYDTGTASFGSLPQSLRVTSLDSITNATCVTPFTSSADNVAGSFSGDPVAGTGSFHFVPLSSNAGSSTVGPTSSLYQLPGAASLHQVSSSSKNSPLSVIASCDAVAGNSPMKPLASTSSSDHLFGTSNII